MNIPKWTAIKDKRPKHGQIVITYHDETGIDVMKCHILENEYGDIMFTSCLGFLTDDVTHWIPIGKTIQRRLENLGYVPPQPKAETARKGVKMEQLPSNLIDIGTNV